MIKNMSWVIASLVLVTNLACTSDGATFELNFTVGNFSGVFGSSAVPNDPVTGSIDWEAAAISAPVLSFDSIRLTLDGHNYAAGEIGYNRADFPFGGIELIGGTINGVNSMASFTDDFWIRWDRNSLMPFDFSYTSSQRYGFWSAYESNPGSFTAFSISEVPEPSIFSLFAFGLLAYFMKTLPNSRAQYCAKQFTQPTPVGHLSFAFAVDIIQPAWLNSGR
jgi:hypothetical protein